MHGKSTPFALFRVEQDGSTEQVSEYGSFEEGWAAGTHAVAADLENAYSLYERGRRIARFGHSRLQPRSKGLVEWGMLHVR